MNMAGERYSYSAEDKLPKSTREMVPLSWGNFLDCTGVSGIPPGNNLIFPSRNIKTAGDAC